MYVPATVFSSSLLTSRNSSVATFWVFNQSDVADLIAPEFAVKVVGVHWEEILILSSSGTIIVLASSMSRMTSLNWALAWNALLQTISVKLQEVSTQLDVVKSAYCIFNTISMVSSVAVLKGRLVRSIASSLDEVPWVSVM